MRGDVVEIAGLAVADVEAGEDAEDLGGALGAHQGVDLGEAGQIEIGIGLAAQLAVLRGAA